MFRACAPHTTVLTCLNRSTLSFIENEPILHEEKKKILSTLPTQKLKLICCFCNDQCVSIKINKFLFDCSILSNKSLSVLEFNYTFALDTNIPPTWKKR